MIGLPRYSGNAPFSSASFYFVSLEKGLAGKTYYFRQILRVPFTTQSSLGLFVEVNGVYWRLHPVDDLENLVEVMRREGAFISLEGSDYLDLQRHERLPFVLEWKGAVAMRPM